MKTDNMVLTTGEFKILKAIADSEFRSDEDLLSPVWQVTETKEDRGYMTSLIKKGLAGVDNTEKGYETCWLTENGVALVKQLRNDL